MTPRAARPRTFACVLFVGCIAAAAFLACAGSPGPVAAPSPEIAVAPPIDSHDGPDSALYAAAAAALAERPCSDEMKREQEAGAADGSPPISNADSVIASLRNQFRRCYQDGLAFDRKMEGKVLVSVRVSPGGSVDSARASFRKGLSSEVEACLVGVLSRATFRAPGGCGSTLQVPVTFVQKKP